MCQAPLREREDSVQHSCASHAPACRAHPKHLCRRLRRPPVTRAARIFGLRAAVLPPGARVRLTSSIVVHGAAGASSRSVKAMLRHHNQASAQHLHQRMQVTSPQLQRAKSACVACEPPRFPK
jgi:hypothetical protein